MILFLGVSKLTSMRSCFAWISVTTKVGCLVAGLSHSIPSLWLQQGSFTLSWLLSSLDELLDPAFLAPYQQHYEPSHTQPTIHSSLTHYNQMWIIEVKSLFYWLTVCLYDWCVSRDSTEIPTSSHNRVVSCCRKVEVIIPLLCSRFGFQATARPGAEKR